MYDNFFIQTVNLNREKERQEITAFLEKNKLAYEPVDYTIRILNPKDEIVGTGSVANKTIKCVAIDETYRETVVFSKIISHLLDYLAKQGKQHCFVFTKPASAQSFVNLGFTEIARAEPLFALLEYGIGGLAAYQAYLKENKKSTKTNNIGALVVNCNPFTNGHRYVIEQAAAACEQVYVFMVQEDRSTFPFEVRYELIKKGTADLKNVCVLKGGEYIISSSTFPTYFVKNEHPGEIERLQTQMDVTIFARHLAPVLGIKTRFVGTEEYCHTTACYNEAMKSVLPQFSIDLKIIERKRLDDDLVVSASHVRRALKEDDWALIQKLVPITTYDFLKSAAAQPIIRKLKESAARH